MSGAQPGGRRNAPAGGRPGAMRTVDLARASDSHPNTVRLYEEWGFIPKAERAPNGYRLWSREHLDQMIFARLALDGFWPGRAIRKSALALVKLAATGDLRAALAAAEAHLGLVRGERDRAREAARALEAWAAGGPAPGAAPAVEAHGVANAGAADAADADDAAAASASAGAAPAPPRAAVNASGALGARSNGALGARKIGGGAGLVTAREAARLVGATPGQLRNWERNGLIDPLRDEETERRLYGEEELGRAKVVRALLLSGYSMMAIRRMAAELDGGGAASLAATLDTPREDEEVLTAFDRWLSFLASQEARAENLLGLLRARLEARAGAEALAGAEAHDEAAAERGVAARRPS